MKKREVTIVKYCLNTEEILDTRLCDSSGICLDCKLSVDQVTTWSRIFLIQHSFGVQFSDSLCYRLLILLPPCRSLEGQLNNNKYKEKLGILNLIRDHFKKVGKKGKSP